MWETFFYCDYFQANITDYRELVPFYVSISAKGSKPKTVHFCSKECFVAWLGKKEDLKK
jgi:hypothetical protein